jgi:cAMP-dependent protein kinase regulator
MDIKENKFEDNFIITKPNDDDHDNDDYDDDDDEEEEEDDDDDDDLDEVKEMATRNSYSRQISTARRVSVFSKTYDPEDDYNDNSDAESNKNNLSTNDEEEEEEEEEIIQNRLYEKQSINKTNEQKQKLHKIISSIIIFKNLYQEEINELIDSMFERKCNQNEEIIREGDNGNYFYVISSGSYEAYIKTSSSSNDSKYGRKVREYNDSGYFGELALLYDQPRLATVICSKDNSVLYCMKRDKFKRLVIGNAFKRRKMYQEFLESVTLLKSSMNDYERSQVADALKTITYKNGDIIFHQNDVDANGMYFIENGKVEIKRSVNGKEILLKVLGVGEYFGELALVNKAPRSATAYIFNNNNNNNNNNDSCKLAFLDLDAFERLMGPCIELLKSNMTIYADLNKDIDSI